MSRTPALGIVGFIVLLSQALSARMVSELAICETKWYFDGEYEVGQYANGDYWVVGPVTIRSITPSFDGRRNGWEVNPVFEGDQGFDSRAGDFSRSLVPSLPYRAQPGQSLVKGVSGPSSRPVLRCAAVLTVVDEVPPDNGAAVFRPPYVGTEKPLYRVSQLRTDLLPTLPPVDPTPTLEWVHERFAPLQLDHKGGGTGRRLHPSEHMPNYGADIGRDNADGALRLMLDDPLADKMPALIVYVQYGIDLYHMMKIGHNWPAGGGHRPGQKLPMSFAAVMLGEEEMITAVRDATCFHEDHGIVFNESTGGAALFGFGDDEEGYWRVVVSGLDGSASGFKAYADPYGYIDGGPEPGSYYQDCCTSQPWKGSALACHLMPEVKALWTDEHFFEYVDRYVSQGLHTRPDPCAPAESNWSNYGRTFGPDGNGGCIKDTDPSDGIGRFPHLHGENADAGGRSSRFQRAMWNAYRESADEASGGGQTMAARGIHPDARMVDRNGQNTLRLLRTSEGFAIEYTLQKLDPIEITVHDMTGRLVDKQTYTPGEQVQGSIAWPSRDRESTVLGSGVYTVTVKSGALTVHGIADFLR